MALYRGGFLHDIGKVGIPDSILFKRGLLSDAEWEIMRLHTVRGVEICRPMKTLAPVLPIIRSHHERWDGSGYPDGLRGEKIPLLARVLQVADIYDALTTARPYKPALSHQEAVEIMLDEARRGWRDPELVSLFAEVAQPDSPASAAGPITPPCSNRSTACAANWRSGPRSSCHCESETAAGRSHPHRAIILHVGAMEELNRKLQEEIRALENELRVELPREILKARAHGDLSENAEYHAAKERQGFVNARLHQVKARLRELSMVDMSTIPRDRVGLGSTVVVLDVQRRTDPLQIGDERGCGCGQRDDFHQLADRPRLARQAGGRLGKNPDSRRHPGDGDRRTAHHSPVDGKEPTNDRYQRHRLRVQKVILLIVRGLALSKIHPNVLTFIGLLINIGAAALLAAGQFRWAGVVIIGAGLFDMVDGRVARETNRVTRFGGFFDSVLDRYSDLFLLMGLLVWYGSINVPFYVVLTAVVMTGSVMVSYTRARAENSIPTCKVGFMERPERVVLLIIGALFDGWRRCCG